MAELVLPRAPTHACVAHLEAMADRSQVLINLARVNIPDTDTLSPCGLFRRRFVLFQSCHAAKLVYERFGAPSKRSVHERIDYLASRIQGRTGHFAAFSMPKCQLAQFVSALGAQIVATDALHLIKVVISGWSGDLVVDRT